MDTFKKNIKENQSLTVELENRNTEYDTINVGDDIIESLKEIIDARKKGVELPNAKELLKTL